MTVLQLDQSGFPNTGVRQAALSGFTNVSSGWHVLQLDQSGFANTGVREAALSGFTNGAGSSDG